VLVVEDRPSVLKVMVAILESAYQVSTAADGAAALSLLQSGTFDVLLTDVRLPGATGFDVLREVRSVSPGTSVVMMTAYANIPDAVSAMRMGAYDYVAKPLDADEIKLVVARAAARARGATSPEAPAGADDAGPLVTDPHQDVTKGYHSAIEEARERASRAYLVELLRLSEGHVTRAATLAGLTRESLHRLMRKYGLRASTPARPEDGEDPAEAQVAGPPDRSSA
jgi:DNA-binding NtrC family response regulator